MQQRHSYTPVRCEGRDQFRLRLGVPLSTQSVLERDNGRVYELLKR